MNIANVVSKSSPTIEHLKADNFTSLKILLSDVSYLYPNFTSWLNFKVRRNLSSNERSVLIAHNGDELIGVSILKKTQQEQKISTFFVAPNFRESGLGGLLMDHSLELLDSASTFITASQERNSDLSPLLKSKGFELKNRIPDLYRQGSTEFFYYLK